MQGVTAYILAKNAATSYTDSKITAIANGFNYKGSVPTIDDLPASATQGDLYNIQTGGCYAWDGSAWYPVTLQGDDGTTFTPSVSEEGVISWTNDGGKENPTPVNIRGPQGIQGEHGIQGEQGEKGDTGVGIATGGTTGQALVKKSGTDYDTEWKTFDIPTKVSDLSNDLNYTQQTYVDNKVATRELEIIPITSYGFDENVRINQEVSGSSLIDKVITATNTDKKQAVIQTGSYKYNVTSILDDSTGIKGFTISTMVIPMTSLSDKPATEKCVFLYNPTTGKTNTYYDKDFTSLEISSAVSSLSTAIASKQDILSAGSNIQITGNAISVKDDISLNSITANSALIKKTASQTDGAENLLFEVTLSGETIQASLAELLATRQVKLTQGTNITIDATGVISAKSYDTEVSELSSAVETKQNELIAGANIVLTDAPLLTTATYLNGPALATANATTKAVISAIDTTYVAGTAIQIDAANNNAINVAYDTTTLSVSDNKLSVIPYTAGTAVAINSSKEISVKVDGQTIFADESGNLTAKVDTYRPFPSSFVTEGTLQEVVYSMVHATGYNQAGMAYLGEISGECIISLGLGNVECKVEFMQDELCVLTINSSDTKPYHWEYNSASTDYTWKKWSEVIPNYTIPQGEESAELTTLRIDGSNFTIQGTSYTAGNEIDITNHVVSVKDTFIARVSSAEASISTLESTLSSKQDKLTAGSNIAISSDNIIKVSDDLVSRISSVESNVAYLSTNKQDKLTATNAITIDNNNIGIAYDTATLSINSDGKLYVSKEGIAYTAGEKVEISSDNKISVSSDFISTVSSNTSDIADFKDGTQSVNSAINAMNYKSGGSIDTAISSLSSAISGKQAILSAGNGISIDNNTVSAKVDNSTVKINTEGKLYANIDLSGKVDKEVSGTNGTAYIFNEADGGGAKFVHTDESESFVGVNDGGSTGLMAQIYADKYVNGKWQGAKLDVTNGGMYYTVGSDAFAQRAVPENELAVKGDITTVSVSSTGTATEVVNYITIDGEEKKLGGTGSYTAGTGIIINTSTISVDEAFVATKSSVQSLESSKQDKLTAGTGITIDENNVISSTGGATYTAGTGIAISSDNVISVNGVPASSIIYTKATTVTTTVGGLKAGLNLQNRTLENIIERLVGSYTPPSFTSSSFGGSGVIINQRTQTSGSYVMGDTAELQSYTVTLSKGTDFNGLNGVVIKSSGNTIYTLTEEERASLVNLGTVTINFTSVTQTLPASSTSGSWVVSATANYSKKSYDENEQVVYNNVDMSAGSISISAADTDTYSSLYYGAIPTLSTIKNIAPSGLATLNDDTTIQLSRKNTLGSITITTQTGIDKAILVYAGTLNDIKIYATSDIANWDIVQQNLSYTRVNDTTYTKQFKIYTQVIAINTFDYTLS